MNQIRPIINQKYQTLAYFGFEAFVLKDFILSNNFKGIDRVVPIGKTADFSLIWDGYDLMNVLTRNIQLF